MSRSHRKITSSTWTPSTVPTLASISRAWIHTTKPSIFSAIRSRGQRSRLLILAVQCDQGVSWAPGIRLVGYARPKPRGLLQSSSIQVLNCRFRPSLVQLDHQRPRNSVRLELVRTTGSLPNFRQFAPERLLGTHLIYPWPDIDSAVQDCVRAANAGAKAVFPPQQAGVPGDPCPGLYDPYYDPFWAACQDLGLVVHIHAGWGSAQGTLLERVASASQQAAETRSAALAQVLDTFTERRPLWQLMWSGVFDRFPNLKVSFVEVHCDWIPGTLAYLDRYAVEHDANMRLSPSEYWRQNCAVGASCVRYGDVAVRHDIGVDKFMFGTDYPHMEGSWPNTLDLIRAAFGDLPEAEVRQILGENAISFYGLNRQVLAAAAIRCGPLPSEVLGGTATPVAPVILEHFQIRSGIEKPSNLHEDKLVEAVSEDLRHAALHVTN